MKRWPFLLPFLLLLFLCDSGCKQEIVEEPYQPTDAYDAYLYSLRQANLDETALGRDWISAGEESLRNPIDIDLPLEEVFYVSPQEVLAVAYRFEVLRGQKIELEVSVESEKASRLFLDCFRLSGESQADWIHVASAGEAEKRLVYEARRDAAYLIRLQPELLRGGRYKVRLSKDASLDFPVAGKDTRSILSVFGVPRDAGRRVHNGVDIFARRHTPVLAPCDARVRRVGENDLGGNVVWLYDAERSISLYFAHLETQDVESNTEVKAGQQIGTVGNTGNARTTPPHLHFGIYARGSGAVDPEPFITKIEDSPRSVDVDLNLLGRWGRSSDSDVSLRTAPNGKGERLLSLKQHSPLKIRAAVYRWYRVEMPDGQTGFIYRDSLEPLAESLSSLQASEFQSVRENPFLTAPAKETLEPGDAFDLLGSYEGYWFVRTVSGQTGWMFIPAAQEDK